MPFLLLCGMGFSAFFAGLGTVVWSLLLISIPFQSRFSFNGRDVSRPDFVASMWPFFAVYFLVLVAFGAVAYSLWKERTWSREAMAGFWVALGLTAFGAQSIEPAPQADFLSGIAAIGFCAILALWYLYGKRSVRAYFSAIRTQASDGLESDSSAARA